MQKEFLVPSQEDGGSWLFFFRMPTPNACKMHHNLTVGFRNEHHLGYKERLKMGMVSFVLMLRGIVTVTDKPHKLIIRVRFPAPPPCRHSTTVVQLTCNHLIGVRFTVAAPYIKSLIGMFVCRHWLVQLDPSGYIFFYFLEREVIVWRFRHKIR